MGKSKRKKFKCHVPAVKLKKESSEENIESMETDKQLAIQAVPRKEQSVGENLFKGININKDLLKQKLPDLDARSTITSKSLKGLNLTKKDKMKMKHELWREKIQLLKKEKKEAKLKKKRQQTPVVGDMTVIEDALPTLELLLKRCSSNKNRKDIKEKPRSIQKEKRRKKEMLDSISLFQQVINHPSYQDDPTAVLSEHITNKLKQENSMDT